VGANDIIQVGVTLVVFIGGAFFILAPSVAVMTMLPIPFIIWGSLTDQNRLTSRYEVSFGIITVDAIDIQKLNLRELRRSIALVSQDVFLFHGSVAENIAYGTFDASDEAIIKAAKVAEAHDFIMGLPDGYETIVGERAQKLSGGQRQRIAIARAIVKNPPILILDEATSAVEMRRKLLSSVLWKELLQIGKPSLLLIVFLLSVMQIVFM
jgi:ABC-type bacteriocin/lantibiotic exporter with double-glycine peptidase domain